MLSLTVCHVIYAFKTQNINHLFSVLDPRVKDKYILTQWEPQWTAEAMAQVEAVVSVLYGFVFL